jgi:sarcosine oxidase
VIVTTPSGVARAKRLVICPGAWAADLLAHLGVPLEIERHVQFWFQPDGGVEPFLPERHPAWLWDGGAGDGLPYSIPAVDGPEGGVKISWHRMGRPAHPDALDRTVSPAEVEAIAEAVRARVPALAGRFLRAVPCMYTNTPDEHFVVGPHPRHPQVVVAAGFCGHGFKFAPVIGEIVSDLVVTGETAHPIGLFDPGRFS